MGHGMAITRRTQVLASTTCLAMIVLLGGCADTAVPAIDAPPTEMAQPGEPTLVDISAVPEVPMERDRILQVTAEGPDGPWYVVSELDKDGFARASRALEEAGFVAQGDVTTDPFDARGVYTREDLTVELTVSNPTGGGFLAGYLINRD